jgi:hypothetical protein
MGYDIHITRAPEWWGDNTAHQITETEWYALVDSDPELRPSTPNDVYHSRHLVLWSGANFEGPWLSWSRGNVYSKNPNGRMVAKMLRLAEHLSARVQGDDREIYLPDGRVQLDDGMIQTNVDWRTW